MGKLFLFYFLCLTREVGKNVESLLRFFCVVLLMPQICDFKILFLCWDKIPHYISCGHENCNPRSLQFDCALGLSFTYSFLFRVTLDIMCHPTSDVFMCCIYFRSFLRFHVQTICRTILTNLTKTSPWISPSIVLLVAQPLVIPHWTSALMFRPQVVQRRLLRRVPFPLREPRRRLGQRCPSMHTNQPTIPACSLTYLLDQIPFPNKIFESQRAQSTQRNMPVHTHTSIHKYPQTTPHTHVHTLIYGCVSLNFITNSLIFYFKTRFCNKTRSVRHSSDCL